MKAPCVLAVLIATGCLYSKDNREGVDLSCTDLQGGSINACKQGIITSCQAGTVEYRVCDDKDACEASWQQQGRFRCAESDAIPSLVLTSGAGGATQDTPGGSGGTSSGSAGSNAQPNGSACSAPCVAADAEGYVSSIASDATSLYFVSGKTITILPKSGGLPAELATIPCAASGIQLAINSTDVFATCGAGSVVRVSKADGSVSTVTSTADAPHYIAADDSLAYWGESYSVQRYALGGSPRAIPVDRSPGRIVMAEGFAYWSTTDGLSRISATGEQPQNLQIGGAPKDFAFADGNVVALLDDRILTYSVAVNAPSTLVQVNAGTALAVKDSYACWTAPGKLNAIPLVGGDPIELASDIQAPSGPGSLIVDEAAIYWIGGTKVYKLDRPW